MTKIKEVQTDQDVLQDFFFPKENITVKARNMDEAITLLNK